MKAVLSHYIVNFLELKVSLVPLKVPLWICWGEFSWLFDSEHQIKISYLIYINIKKKTYFNEKMYLFLPFEF